MFLDLVMPPENGPGMLLRIKMDMPKVPVVIVTGYPDSDLLNECLKYGCLGMVKKPLDLMEIESVFMNYKVELPKKENEE